MGAVSRLATPSSRARGGRSRKTKPRTVDRARGEGRHLLRAPLSRLSGLVGRIRRRLLVRRSPRRASAPEPARRASPELRPSPAPRGFIWVFGLSVALAAASFVFHLGVRFEIIQTGYALSQAQSEQRRLRLEQRELRLELATLKAPSRIEQQARERLGMVRPEHDRTVRIGGQRTRLAQRRRR